MAIEKFRGEYFPFSNMYPLPNWIEADCGLIVPTSEHAYMAGRFADSDVQRDIAGARGQEDDRRPSKDGIAAKERAYEHIHAGASLAVRDDFGKIALMQRVVRRKVEHNPSISGLLRDTGSQEIVEGNNWGDRFWGVSPVGSSNGANHLGRILMNLRAEL